NLPFELREREENIQCQTAERRGRVELLGHGNKTYRTPVEAVHQPCEIEERPAEPVDLIDEDAIHTARFDVVEETPQGRALQVSAAEPSVVVPVRNELPAGLLLARDIGFGRLALRMKRVELLVEPFFGRFARVDGAADYGRDGYPSILLIIEAVMHFAAPPGRRTTARSSECR